MKLKKAIILFSALILITALYVLKITCYSYNPDFAAEYATKHANTKSKGLCGYYVRLSIEAGGCPTFFFPRSASEYVSFLPDLGFTKIDASQKRFKGDIVVFNAVEGHPFGHIAIWNGKQWISDFKQRGIIVNQAYRISDATFFRLERGKHKRVLFPANHHFRLFKSLSFK